MHPIRLIHHHINRHHDDLRRGGALPASRADPVGERIQPMLDSVGVSVLLK
jgi:hypothetical protein